MSERSIFMSALEVESPAERAIYLEAACAGDTELRKRVDALLDAHLKAGGLLDQPALPGMTEIYRPISESAGIVIGPYKLLQQLGEGGMGVVYLAEQEQPVRRKVALKIIKPGMDTRQVIARFESERQALALMDHPHIAKVLDAGATETGRPYFVMELVKGIPITTYCDQEHLTPAARLALVLPVCQAVQHAHQKGIIHRDLKPSNVLIALYDGRPVPKVIDFGVAKATNQKLTERTMFTEVGSMIGTLEYMAPEQAELNNLDVDTRADIYSLGVLLYEILTGSPPFSSHELRKAGLGEMLRMIKEVEPQKPSTRLSTSHELSNIAAKRKLEPKRLTKQISGELDWIVMKCLEKERGRRYETATGLAEDLQRYIDDEPVLAGPPSRLYRARKFVRKYRTALLTTVLTTLAFAAMLTAFASIAVTLAVQAQRAASEANIQRQAAEANAKQAEAFGAEALYNARQYQDALLAADVSRQQAEMAAASLQIDLDLANMGTDPRVDLLRLASTLRKLPAVQPYGQPLTGNGQASAPVNVPGLPEARRNLREFVTAAILTGGQEHALLLPPITHEGHEIISHAVSPDNKTVLTLGEDRTARLWDTSTGRSLAVLRQGTERVLKSDISRDGRTVFTADESNVVRFWDMPGGKFRSKTEPRRDRYEIVGDLNTNAVEQAKEWCKRDASTCVANGNRLITRRIVVKTSESSFSYAAEGPVELWDMDTGTLVKRLDGPETSVDRLGFLGDGRWITTVTEGKASSVMVFSATDGMLMAHLEHPVGEIVSATASSSSGRRIATISALPDSKGSLRVWNTGTWQLEPGTAIVDPAPASYSGIAFCTDNLVGLSATMDFEIAWEVFRIGRVQPVVKFHGLCCEPLLPDGELMLLDSGQLFDVGSGKRLTPPAGRRFHPSLTRFARDGRFVALPATVIDTLTDKQIGPLYKWGGGRFVPDCGMASISINSEFAVELRQLSASHLNIPADLLELWAQVAVRGETSSEGTFLKWDESTWDKKRQDLAARHAAPSSPHFPGHLANDRLHWLRSEYESAGTKEERLRLAKELHHRAQTASDMAETARWRKEQTKMEQFLAPPPNVN